MSSFDTSNEMSTAPDDHIHMTEELGTILLIIIQSIYTLILTPISIYYAHKFFKLSSCKENIPFFSKRHPEVIIWTVFLFNMYPVIIRPISDFVSLWNLSGFIYISPHLELISHLLNNTNQLLAYAAVTRLWLLYYDYNHELQLLSMIWKQQIGKKQNIPWTFRYKWLGSIKVLMIIWIIFCIVIMIYLRYIYIL